MIFPNGFLQVAIRTVIVRCRNFLDINEISTFFETFEYPFAWKRSFHSVLSKILFLELKKIFSNVFAMSNNQIFVVMHNYT
jgi:hypothetical protein